MVHTDFRYMNWMNEDEVGFICALFSEGRAVCLAVPNMEGEEFDFRVISEQNLVLVHCKHKYLSYQILCNT